LRTTYLEVILVRGGEAGKALFVNKDISLGEGVIGIEDLP
jgi:hypothetical protein